MTCADLHLDSVHKLRSQTTHFVYPRMYAGLDWNIHVFHALRRLGFLFVSAAINSLIFGSGGGGGPDGGPFADFGAVVPLELTFERSNLPDLLVLFHVTPVVWFCLTKACNSLRS